MKHKIKNKIVNVDIRPVIRPKSFMFILLRFVNQNHLKPYLIQSKLESSKLENTLFNMPKKKNIPHEIYDDLNTYEFILNNIDNISDKEILFNMSTIYSKYVTGDVTIQDWMQATNQMDQWQRSKVDFKRSISQIKQGKIEGAISSAVKAYKKVPSSALYLWNRNVMSLFEQSENLLHILSDTYLLARLSKRLKYFSVLNMKLQQLINCLAISTHFYSQDDHKKCELYFSDLKNRYLVAVKKDVEHFNYDPIDKQELLKIQAYYI